MGGISCWSRCMHSVYGRWGGPLVNKGVLWFNPSYPSWHPPRLGRRLGQTH